MERILIVRLGAMGDIIHALPTVAAFRERYPDAVVDWLVEPRWVELLAAKGAELTGPRTLQKPVVDNIYLGDTKTWRKHLFSRETRRSIIKLRHELRERKYTCAVDMQGAMKSAVLARQSGAKKIIGYSKPREIAALPFYNQLQDAEGHVIERGALLLGFSGMLFEQGGGDHLARFAMQCFPRDNEAEQWANHFVQEKFAILTPAAGWAAKEWAPERFGELARQLVRVGLQPVVNIGPGERESAIADAVETGSGGSAKRVLCSIGQLIALTRRAALFIGGDTGPMHLANALGVPVVAIFGPTDPARNGPYYDPHVVLRSPLSKTSYSHVDTAEPGIRSITVERVMEAAHKLLEQRA
jgi:heptosyltransferase I